MKKYICKKKIAKKRKNSAIACGVKKVSKKVTKVIQQVKIAFLENGQKNFIYNGENRHRYKLYKIIIPDIWEMETRLSEKNTFRGFSLYKFIAAQRNMSIYLMKLLLIFPILSLFR